MTNSIAIIISEDGTCFSFGNDLRKFGILGQK